MDDEIDRKPFMFLVQLADELLDMGDRRGLEEEDFPASLPVRHGVLRHERAQPGQEPLPELLPIGIGAERAA